MSCGPLTAQRARRGAVFRVEVAMKVARRSGAGAFARLVPVPALAALLGLPALLGAAVAAPALAAPVPSAAVASVTPAPAGSAAAGSAAAAAVPASAVPGALTGPRFGALPAPAPPLVA